MFTVSQEDADTFSRLEDEAALKEWMSKRYQAYMTEDGIDAGMQNRLLSQGVALQMQGNAVELSDISVTERDSESEDSDWYNYEVTLQTGDKEASFLGSMHLTKQDGVWLVNDIGVDGKKL